MTAEKKTLKPAAWFSRHKPTDAQLAEIARSGHKLAVVAKGMALGIRDLHNEGDVVAVVTDLQELVKGHNAAAIYGVFPAMVQEVIAYGMETYAGWITSYMAGEYIAADAGTPCYAAWNVTRAVEGGRPTFHHQRFCYTGRLPTSPINKNERWVKK